VEFLSANQRSDIELTVNPEAISMREIDLYKILDCFEFGSVTIVTHNQLEAHDRYCIQHIKRNIFLEENGTPREKHWEWNKKKKFLTIYGRPTASRIGIAAHLFDNHAEHTHLHFSWPTDNNSLQVFELDKLLNYRLASIEPAGRLIKNMPCCVQPSQGYDKAKYNYNDDLTALYQDCLIDLVAESHVKGATFFPTEKTFRPMWCRRPFIVFGSANYLEYLRQMGFRTFGDFWDESYDGYEGADRFCKILELIDNLAQKSYDELETMYWNMQYSLEHNHSVLRKQKYNLNTL